MFSPPAVQIADCELPLDLRRAEKVAHVPGDVGGFERDVLVDDVGRRAGERRRLRAALARKRYVGAHHAARLDEEQRRDLRKIGRDDLQLAGKKPVSAEHNVARGAAFADAKRRGLRALARRSRRRKASPSR